MSRFYIKSIGASGPKVEYSQVTFDEGVNNFTWTIKFW